MPGTLENYMLSKDGRGAVKKRRQKKGKRSLTPRMVGGTMSSQEDRVASATRKKGY